MAVEKGSQVVCNALPLRGDGSGWCTLAPFHKGLHEGAGGAFRRCVFGTSPRSPLRVRQRRARAAAAGTEDVRG
jgi:hypothetical protein